MYYTEISRGKKIQSTLPVHRSTFCAVSCDAFLKTFWRFLLLRALKCTKLHKLTHASQRQHLFLHASRRPWLNFEHQLVGHIETCFSSKLTEQNPYEPRWQDWITSANTSYTMPPDSPRKQKAHSVSKRGEVRKKSWTVTERRNQTSVAEIIRFRSTASLEWFLNFSFINSLLGLQSYFHCNF